MKNENEQSWVIMMHDWTNKERENKNMKNIKQIIMNKNIMSYFQDMESFMILPIYLAAPFKD